jgi:hypothetical protein
LQQCLSNGGAIRFRCRAIVRLAARRRQRIRGNNLSPLKFMFDIAGIFGPKKSGKTTLACELARQIYARENRLALIFDPWLGEMNWGKNAALVTKDEKQFWETVWNSQKCLVICDEAAMTIKRDKTLIPAFTAIRHQLHRFLVIGHDFTDLLPTMRKQLDALFLFRQDEDSAANWARLFTDKRLVDAAQLNQYEFISKQMFRDPVKTKLPPPK